MDGVIGLAAASVGENPETLTSPRIRISSGTPQRPDHGLPHPHNHRQGRERSTLWRENTS